jgi:Ca2+-transporting ATPase
MSIAIISTLMAAVVLYLFNHYLGEGTDIARTISFTAIVVLELVRVTMIRAQYRQGFFSNPMLFGALLISVALQAGVVYIPFMNTVFKTVPLQLGHWLHIGAASVAMAAACAVSAAVLGRISRRAVPTPS